MRALRTVLTFACLLLFGLPAVAVAEPDQVAIGYPPATDFLAAYVAMDQGIFAEHNIDATMVKNSRRPPIFPRQSSQAASRSG